MIAKGDYAPAANGVGAAALPGPGLGPRCCDDPVRRERPVARVEQRRGPDRGPPRAAVGARPRGVVVLATSIPAERHRGAEPHDLGPGLAAVAAEHGVRAAQKQKPGLGAPARERAQLLARQRHTQRPQHEPVGQLPRHGARDRRHVAWRPPAAMFWGFFIFLFYV
jgi:hypothetical protein